MERHAPVATLASLDRGERLHPTEWQITLLWAALAGFLGALGLVAVLVAVRGRARLVDPLAGRCRRVDAAICPGGLASPRRPWAGRWPGWVLLFGKKLTRNQSSTDYMEAIAIGNGRIPIRASLVKTGAALFSIGLRWIDRREGPMVQLAAVVFVAYRALEKIYPAPATGSWSRAGPLAGIASAL